MIDNEAAGKIRQDIEKLIKSYNDIKKSKNEKEIEAISEANVRADFIDSLFEILGWDIRNPDEYDREHFIRGAGFADIALKLDKKPVIFIEAKRFGAIPHSKDVKGDWTLEERQSILYAAGKHCKWAILTNFEKFRVFNALTGLTTLNFESVFDYKDRIGDLLYLTKDAVESGRIEKLGAREEKPDVDLEFLDLLNRWRIELANDIYVNNFLNEGKPPDLSKLFPDYKKHENDPRYAKFLESRREILRKRLDFSVLKDEKGNFDIERLKSAVQRILDRLIIVRWAEDHLLLDDPNVLDGKLRLYKATSRYNPLYEALFSDGALFDRFNEIHNGEIFRRGLYYDRITVSDEVLKRIIEEMTSYSFRKFDFDVLGNTYETYLGNMLYLKEDNTFDLKPSQETRKESGIYYTPPYVVDYIVKNTLGALLKDKTPQEVERIKVLDPACGSGSFLIKAYDCFANYYEEKNREIKKRIDEHVRKGMLFETSESKHEGYEASILMNNLHGVDLDAQAAEIAAVNLMLKALKPDEMLPPILGETIKVGNSLISASEEELKKYFGEEWRAKKPFNWEEEFADVFDAALAEKERGFDVVIGNPPYFKMEGRIDEQNYFEAFNSEIYRGKNDVYYYFIVKGLNLLNNNGVLGYIVERYFFEATYADKLRKFITENASIEKIIDFGDVQIFPDAGNHTCIILLRKGKSENNSIKVVKVKKGMASDEATTIKANEKLMQHVLKHIAELNYEDEYIKIFNLNQNSLGTEQWILASESGLGLLDKIEHNTWKLIELCEIEQGQKSGLNGVFAVTDKEINQYRLEKELLKKLIKNSDIRRYQLNWQGNYLIYTSDTTDIENYPNIKHYFESFKDKLLKRAEVDENKYAWFRLQRPRRQELFDVPEKIIVPYRAPENRFAYDPYQCYNDGGDIRVIVPKKEISVQLKYILGILNSKTINYYYKFIGRPKGDVYEYFVEPLSRVPIRKIDFSNPSEKSDHDDLVALVDRMLTLNKQLNEISADFQHYLNLRPHSTAPLRSFMEALPAKDKEVLKHHTGKSVSTIEAEKFEAFDVVEEGEWLVFMVSYTYTSGKGKPLSSSNVRALRLRIPDISMRKFIFYSLKDTARGKLGSGNILEQLLKLKIPRLVTNGEDNRRAIEELMAPFLVEVAKKEALEREIKETDETIDKKVYALYGLSDEEIRIIEESSKK